MFSDAVRINYDSIVAVLVINCDQVSTLAPLPLCRLVPGVQTAEIAATDGRAPVQGEGWCEAQHNIGLSVTCQAPATTNVRK